jgi:hypothetical protein
MLRLRALERFTRVKVVYRNNFLRHQKTKASIALASGLLNMWRCCATLLNDSNLSL